MNRNLLKAAAAVTVGAAVFMIILFAAVMIKMPKNEPVTAAETECTAEPPAEQFATYEDMEEYTAEQFAFDEKRYATYTYEDMESDLRLMSRNFADKARLTPLAQTADGRTVYDLEVGKQGSQNQYIVTGSIHAREYITSKLVMLLLNDYISKYDGKDELIHFVPMVNPDGVSISQFGMDGIRTEAVRTNINSIAVSDGKSTDDFNYLRQWKANANGVDLNRNFDAMWESYEGTPHPSSDRYKGSAVGCESESAALIELTKNNPIKKTISYHTMGQVIYWYFAQEGGLLTQTKAFADKISAETGYMTDANYEALDPAGYKDWAVSKLSIPSVTIEVGTGENPVDELQTDKIYEENKNVIGIMSE